MCAPERGTGAPLGMRPRRCAQARVCPSAKASRYRVASPRAGPLLHRTRAHLASVCASSEANFATFVHLNARSIIQHKRRDQRSTALEPAVLKIHRGLHDYSPCVHHKWSVSGNGLIQLPARYQEEPRVVTRTGYGQYPIFVPSSDPAPELHSCSSGARRQVPGPNVSFLQPVL